MSINSNFSDNFSDNFAPNGEEWVSFNPFASVEEGGFLLYEEPCVEEVEEGKGEGFSLPKEVVVNLVVRGVFALLGGAISLFGGLTSYSAAHQAIWEKATQARYSEQQLQLSRCLAEAPDEPQFCARQKREVNKLRKEVLDLQQAFVWEGVLEPGDLEYHEKDMIFPIYDSGGNLRDPYGD